MGLFKSKESIIKEYFEQQKKEENVVILQKNRHIAMLEKIIDSLEAQIAGLVERMEDHKSGSTEDRFLDILEGMLSPKPTVNVTGSAEVQQVLPGGSISDDQIKRVLSRAPKKKLAEVISQGEEVFGKEVRSKFPDMSDETITRAFKIAGEMVNNG